MVDALREARRVLQPRGVLIDVRPLPAPMEVQVLTAAHPIWSKKVDACSTPEDIRAADTAIEHALRLQWFVSDKTLPFDLEIYCDSAAELSLYAQARKLRETEIPYRDLEALQREWSAGGQATRVRCRRRWMLSTYRKK